MARKAFDFDPDVSVPGYILGKVIGISGQAVGKLRDGGVLQQDSQRMYPLSQSVQAYLAFRSGARGDQQPDQEKTLDGEELRLKSAKADLAELALSVKRRSLIPAEEIGPSIREVLSAIRTNFLSSDIRFGQEGAGLEAEDLQTVARGIIIDILDDCSNLRIEGVEAVSLDQPGDG